MGYHRITRLIFLSLSWLFAPLVSFVEALRELPAYFDAKTALALDRLARVMTVLPAMRSRFDAFINRALSHDHYGSGHFDPGRAAA